jgi:hypothetical protein
MKATDEHILLAMRARPHGIMTYVIRNILVMEHGYRDLEMSAVLYRLKRLESAGAVCRVQSSYVTMLCWAIVKQAGSDADHS